MAQKTVPMQIVAMTGVASGSNTPFLNPLAQRASAVIIQNPDTNPITISTDDTGTPSISIPQNGYYIFRLSGNQPWKQNELIFFVSGNVTLQPIVIVES